MPQLKSLINRTNVPLHPKNYVNVPRGTVFVRHYNYSTHPLPPLQVTLKGHVVAAFMNHYNMKTMDDNFPQHILCSLMQATMAERKVHFHKLVHNILQDFQRILDRWHHMTTKMVCSTMLVSCSLVACYMPNLMTQFTRGMVFRLSLAGNFSYYISVQHTAQNMHWNPLHLW